MKDEPIQKLNMRARGAVVRRNPPELGCELLEQKGVLYSVSQRHTRHMPKIKLP